MDASRVWLGLRLGLASLTASASRSSSFLTPLAQLKHNNTTSPLLSYSPHLSLDSIMTTALRANLENETPSKAVAASLSTIDLSKPSSIAAKLTQASADANTVLSSTGSIKKEHKSAQVVDVTTTGPTGRDRFVGNLDITCDADEPLLKETGNRFVLFPIKYHEVSRPFRLGWGGRGTARGTRAGRVFCAEERVRVRSPNNQSRGRRPTVEQPLTIPSLWHLMIPADLAAVQARRGFVLDRRGSVDAPKPTGRSAPTGAERVYRSPRHVTDLGGCS